MPPNSPPTNTQHSSYKLQVTTGPTTSCYSHSIPLQEPLASHTMALLQGYKEHGPTTPHMGMPLKNSFAEYSISDPPPIFAFRHPLITVARSALRAPHLAASCQPHLELLGRIFDFGTPDFRINFNRATPKLFLSFLPTALLSCSDVISSTAMPLGRRYLPMLPASVAARKFIAIAIAIASTSPLFSSFAPPQSLLGSG